MNESLSTAVVMRFSVVFSFGLALGEGLEPKRDPLIKQVDHDTMLFKDTFTINPITNVTRNQQ